MTKKNLILGGLLVFLIALAYVYQGPFKDWQAGIGKPKNFLAGLDVSQVNKIEVTSFGQTTVLEKSGDKWKINGTKNFFVNDTVASGLVSSLTEAAKADVEVVSENKDKKGEFQADADSGIAVKLMQGDNVVNDFTIGKLSSDFKSTYISETNSDKTYAVKANLNSTFAQDDWYDKAMFKADKELITKIRFQYPDRQFTVEKKDGKWVGVAPKSFPVTAEKMDKILTVMTSLTAVKVPEQTFKGTGLEKHGIIVEATGEGIDNLIMVGDKNPDNEYFAKKGDSDNIYLISKDDRDSLNKKVEDLK